MLAIALVEHLLKLIGQFGTVSQLVVFVVNLHTVELLYGSDIDHRVAQTGGTAIKPDGARCVFVFGRSRRCANEPHQAERQ